MEIIDINDYKKLLLGSFFIGSGTTANCFLMKDKNVFKLYKWYHREINPDKTQDIIDNLTYLSTIKNDTYVAPEKIVISNGIVVGYIYPYVKAKTYARISMNTKLNDMLLHINKLIEDTKEASDKGLYLIDMHYKNLLYNGKFYVIDLDRSYYIDSKTDFLYKSNLRQLYETIFYHIYKVGPRQKLEFDDPEYAKLFFNTHFDSEDEVNELFECIKDKTNDPNPTLGKVRRIKHKTFDYYIGS